MNNNQIPLHIEKRLSFFKNQVNERFSFLKDFNYFLNSEQSGRTENFKDYFSEFRFANGDTVISVHFSTDIIEGMKMSFPRLKQEELPVVDSSITCFIRDKNALMSVDDYVELKFPDIPADDFRINLGSPDLEIEIAKVTKNFSSFFKANLKSVLEKEVIYDCYTDRFYNKVFKEIHYR